MTSRFRVALTTRLLQPNRAALSLGLSFLLSPFSFYTFYFVSDERG
jgi:hypothetical protein